MSGRHGRISTEIWANDDFTALPHHSQWLYMTLLSQPDINAAGVIGLQVKRWATLTIGFDTPHIEHAIAVLDSRGFIVADEATDELLVRTYIRNDGVADQPNILANACRSLLGVRSMRLRAALLAELRKIPAACRDRKYRVGKTSHRPVGELVDETIKRLDERVGGVVYTSGPPPVDLVLGPVGTPSGNPLPNPSANPLPNPLGAGATSTEPNGVVQGADLEERSDDQTLSQTLSETLPQSLYQRVGGGGGGSTSVTKDQKSSSSSPYVTNARIDATSDKRATSEQGDDQRSTPTPKITERTPGAKIANTWANDERRRVPGKPMSASWLGGLARQIDNLLESGFSEAQIRVALDIWRAGGWGVSKLPDFADDVVSGPEAVVLDPDRELTNHEIIDLVGGVIPDPLPLGWWRDVALPEARKIQNRNRVKIIETKRARTR